MKLINFHDDLGFIRLRQLMEASAEGHFELFDPAKHTSLEQRSLLTEQGLPVKAGNLMGIKAKTLHFLDCKVVAIDAYQHLHFTRCPQIKQDASASLRAFTHLNDDWEGRVQICERCLGHWQASQSGRRRQRQPFLQDIQDLHSLVKWLKLGRCP